MLRPASASTFIKQAEFCRIKQPECPLSIVFSAASTPGDNCAEGTASSFQGAQLCPGRVPGGFQMPKFQIQGRKELCFYLLLNTPPPDTRTSKSSYSQVKVDTNQLSSQSRTSGQCRRCESQQQAGTAATEASLRHPKIIWQPATTDTALSPRLPQALTSLFWHNTTGLP